MEAAEQRGSASPPVQISQGFPSSPATTTTTALLSQGQPSNYQSTHHDDPVKGWDDVHIHIEGQREPVGKPTQLIPPEEYKRWEERRLCILLLTATPALIPPMGMTMYLPSLSYVIEDFETTEEMVALTISIFALLLCICPIFWGAYSDRYGRKPIILSSMAISAIGCMLCWLATNIEFFIAARAIQGMGMSAAIVIGGAVVADIYPPHIRGNAMGWFSLTALLGPVIGPSLGGIIGQFFGWRAIFFLLAIVTTCFWLGIMTYLPETLSPNSPKRSPNPIHTIKFLFHPPITPVALMNGIVSSSMILLLFVFPLEMARLYGLNQAEIGVAYTPFGIGACLGSLCGGRSADWAFSWKGSGARLLPSLIAALCVNIGTSGFAWTVDYNVWIAVGFTALTGFCVTFARPGMTTFSIERQPHSAGGVMAAIFSFQFFCGFLLITSAPPLIGWLSLRWTLAGIAGLSFCVAVPFAYVMLSYLTTPNSLLSPTPARKG